MKTDRVTYDIKLDKSAQPNGTIDFDRLAFLADKISKIAKGALQIRIGGMSHKKGKAVKDLDKALQIRLTGIKEGSTVLNCETQSFGNTISGIQIDAFRPNVALELLKQTPMSLFMLAFTEAFDDSDEEKPFLDKPLIKDLIDLKSFFKDDTEELIISNNNNTPTITIKKKDFSKIKQLEESYPEPQNIVVNGKIDILQHSKSKVTINTEQGTINGILKDTSLNAEIKQYWGTDATVYGIGHSTQDDKYFSRIPFAESAEQQILKQIIDKSKKNWANDIFGKWPGEETDEEFDTLLKNL